LKGHVRLAGVAGVGDVNGDRRSDVLVGAPYGTSPEIREGSAYLYLAAANGLSTTPSWSRQANQQAAFFGMSVAAIGDIDGDGLSDALIGAPGHAGGGKAFVYTGDLGGTLGNVAWTDVGGSGSFGMAVAGVGDSNGDGYADMVVGAPSYDDGSKVDAGIVWKYLNTASGIGTAHSFITGDMAGSSMAARSPQWATPTVTAMGTTPRQAS
jgi:hypothetical protein